MSEQAPVGVRLASARYGKDKVRVLRVVRHDGNGKERWHDVVEYNVCTLVEGDIETSFTKADNSVVVATDSIKNMTYYMAKTSPFILQPETFALHLGTFILKRYAHLKKASVSVEQLRWQRISVGAEGQAQAHGHAFWRDGEEKRVVSVKIDATAGKDKMVTNVTSGLKDLLVLKTTGSAFENFVRDEFTTLVEVDDRIFSTAVDLQYTFQRIDLGSAEEEGLKKVQATCAFDKIAGRAREITLETFATDESASVQATLFKMGKRIVEEHELVQEVSYQLPNKHYIPVDMRYIGVENLKPAEAEVFCPIAAPSGLICGSVSRE